MTLQKILIHSVCRDTAAHPHAFRLQGHCKKSSRILEGLPSQHCFIIVNGMMVTVYVRSYVQGAIFSSRDRHGKVNTRSTMCLQPRSQKTNLKTNYFTGSEIQSDYTTRCDAIISDRSQRHSESKPSFKPTLKLPKIMYVQSANNI